MNHLVFLDPSAGELEKILSGVKRMLVADFDPTQPGAASVAPGDGLYFLRDREDRTIRVKATVVRVQLAAFSADRDLSNTLKEMQPKLQLTEEQYNHWSARRHLLLVEFESAHKTDAVPLARSRIADPSNWIVFGEPGEITE